MDRKECIIIVVTKEFLKTHITFYSLFFLPPSLFVVNLLAYCGLCILLALHLTINLSPEFKPHKDSAVVPFKRILCDNFSARRILAIDKFSDKIIKQFEQSGEIWKF